MPQEHSRRRFLQLTGVTTAATLGGCATALDNVSQGNETTPSDGNGGATPRPTTAGNDRVRTAEEVETTEPAETATETPEEWSTEEVTIDTPDVSFSSVPVPEEPSRYARMGQSGTAPTATVIGNWKCPYTQEFVLEGLPRIVSEFVDPGHLTLEFRALAYQSGEPFLGPDAPRAARAGLAVWDLDPSSYWSYFGHVFANQPQERRAWAQPSLLTRFAEASGVADGAELQRRIADERYADRVTETTDTARARGVSTVPRVVFDGSVTAPTVDFERTREQLDAARR